MMSLTDNGANECGQKLCCFFFQNATYPEIDSTKRHLVIWIARLQYTKFLLLLISLS